MASDRNLIRFDWAMKRLLRNKANFVVLEGFLSELFKFDIKITELIESESNRFSFDDKLNRIDIIAKTSDNEIILIELQIADELDYFHRILYGVSKAVAENIKSGEAYLNVKKVYSISIVYFELGQGVDYVYHGITEFRGIHNKDILILSEKQKTLFGKSEVKEIFPEYYVIKVNTFNDMAKDSLDEWIYYLKNNEILDNFSAKGLHEAKEVLLTDKMNKQEQEAYKQHLENLRYEKSMLISSRESGRIEGEQIGIEKGRAEGEYIKARKTVLKMLRKKMNVEDISELTGLSIEEIAKLSELLDKYGDEAEKHL